MILKNLKVNRQDFLGALNEVQPAFGVSEEELASRVPGGIIEYSHSVQSILNDGALFCQAGLEQSKRLLLLVFSCTVRLAREKPLSRRRLRSSQDSRLSSSSRLKLWLA